MASDILFAQMRVVIADINNDEIKNDRAKFFKNIINETVPKLQKLGIKIIKVEGFNTSLN